METERSENYLPATSPAWADYYRAAKKRRTLGRGERGRITRASKRRRLREYAAMVVSTALIGVITFTFYVLLR